MDKKPKKSNKRPPTTRQRIAIKHLLENSGSVADALRVAGYSPGTIKNPQTFTNSKAYIEVLNRNGLDDESLSLAHRDILEATVFDEVRFPRIRSKDVKKVAAYMQKIKDTIESNKGHVFLYVFKQIDGDFVAYFKRPEANIRGRGVEMAYKVKGHFAPIKVDAPLGGYNIDPKDKEKLDNIFDGI